MPNKNFSSPSKLNLAALPGPHDTTRVVLPNGISVLVRENPGSPSVVLDGALQAGAIYEGRARAGLASFTADMLKRGCAQFSFDEIYERLEAAGANLGFSSGVHTLSVGGKALAEDLELLLELGAAVLQAPTFPVDHIERVRGEILTSLALRAHDTRAVSAMAFYDALYGAEHPYGYEDDGYPDTVQAITAADLSAYHAAHYGPAGMSLVIVGGVTVKAAVALVERYFGSWKNPQQAARAAAPGATAPSAPITRRMPLAGKTQSDVVLGFLGPRRADADYQAARVANNILGVFGMYGRLGASVRNRAGLAYYSLSRINASFGPGTWRMLAGVNPANVDKTVKLMMREAERMTSTLVTVEELAENQSQIIGMLPLQLESNEGVAGALASMESFGLGLDYLQRMPGIIAALTRPELREAARRYLQPQHRVLAVAGPE